MVTKVEDVRAIGAASPGPARSVAGRSVIVGEWLKNRVVKSALFALGDGAALVLAHIAAKAAVHYVLHIPG
ncbi:MAG TPA: hypothetical protein VJR26_06265, partial [Candidatus Acidoferrales bacterium]|nr:hypothetical protein [Candidatus Acidoferrales bacterium]